MNNELIKDPNNNRKGYKMTKRVRVVKIEKDDYKELDAFMDKLALSNNIDFRSIIVNPISTQSFVVTWNECIEVRVSK